MTLTIDLPVELEKNVRQHAARTGEDISKFVVDAVREKLAKTQTFAEICAPIAEAVAATGISDEEFDRFFEEMREEVWREKQGQKP